MYFIDGLPKYDGKPIIFVVIDRLTKYAHFLAFTHPFLAKNVAQLFLNNLYKLQGL